MNNTKRCPYAKKCSGCQLQNLTYEEQLKMKQVKLIKLLGRFCHVDEILGMEQPEHYRNKLQAAFAHKDGRLFTGIYQSSRQTVTEVDHCMLEDIRSQKIVKSVESICRELKIKAYDIRRKSGVMRHIMVRCGAVSSEIMVVLVTASYELPHKEKFVDMLIKAHPEITTVVHNVNDTDTPLFLTAKSRVLYGEGYISDSLCSLSFKISPRSFYQVNHVQTEKLYSLATELACLTGRERVIDAYCGTGTISLCMAKKARQVLGVELSSDAVRDARDNAKINGIKNAKFFCADAGEFMTDMAEKGEKADVVITDPPRAGCSRAFLQSLVKLSPARVVYISCNPETLARDLSYLTRNGFRVKRIQPVDMFPYTSHVETIVCLDKR